MTYAGDFLATSLAVRRVKLLQADCLIGNTDASSQNTVSKPKTKAVLAAILTGNVQNVMQKIPMMSEGLCHKAL